MTPDAAADRIDEIRRRAEAGMRGAARLGWSLLMQDTHPATLRAMTARTDRLVDDYPWLLEDS